MTLHIVGSLSDSWTTLAPKPAPTSPCNGTENSPKAVGNSTLGEKERAKAGPSRVIPSTSPSAHSLSCLAFDLWMDERVHHRGAPMSLSTSRPHQLNPTEHFR